MSTIATTTMSSRGQIVIPEAVRKALKLEAGTQFVVVGEKDTVVLKPITEPSLEELEELIAEARSQARRAGLKRSDITAAVARARARR
jgi:AbrB family looped-hinge helix DNA binding protein